MKKCSRGLNHMGNMAATPIYDKKPLKFYFSRTNKPMALKLGMLHWVRKHSQGGSNYDPGLIMTYFTQKPKSLRLLYWKKQNDLFLQTITALGLKTG